MRGILALVIAILFAVVAIWLLIKLVGLALKLLAIAVGIGLAILVYFAAERFIGGLRGA